MKNLNITDVEYDLKNGFFWIDFENKKSIQCCLMERKDGDGFKKALILMILASSGVLTLM